MKTVLLTLLALSCLGLFFAIGVVMRRARLARIERFASRVCLTMPGLCRAHFPGSPQEVVVRCLLTIARVTGIDAGRLRPGDRFDRELKLPRGSSIAGEWDDLDDGLNGLPQHLRPHAKIHSLGDYVAVMGGEPTVAPNRDRRPTP